jgi:hypothetical protein
MFRGACIAVVCLAIGGFFGYQFGWSSINKKLADMEKAHSGTK